MSVMDWVGGGLAGCESRYGKVLVENNGEVEVNVALLKPRRVLRVRFESGNKLPTIEGSGILVKGCEKPHCSRCSFSM